MKSEECILIFKGNILHIVRFFCIKELSKALLQRLQTILKLLNINFSESLLNNKLYYNDLFHPQTIMLHIGYYTIIKE